MVYVYEVRLHPSTNPKALSITMAAGHRLSAAYFHLLRQLLILIMQLDGGVTHKPCKQHVTSLAYSPHQRVEVVNPVVHQLKPVVEAQEQVVYPPHFLAVLRALSKTAFRL